MSNIPFPFIIQTNAITCVINGVPHTVTSDSDRYEVIFQLLKDKRFSDINKMFELPALVTKVIVMSDGAVSLDEDGNVTVNGIKIGGSCAAAIAEMWKNKFPMDNIVRFVERLYSSDEPLSYNREELYDYCKANSLPIDNEGYVIAYKRVRGDYLDVYSGTISNAPGTTVMLPRDKCDANREVTCSRGLHVCGYDYLSSFSGERVITVRIDPKDFVAFPKDYHNTKARVCRYQVIGDVTTSVSTVANEPKTIGTDKNLNVLKHNQEQYTGGKANGDSIVLELLNKLTLPIKKAIYNELATQTNKKQFTAQRFRDHTQANDMLTKTFEVAQLVAACKLRISGPNGK